MNRKQLEKLLELTSDLNLIKKIADEDIYTIDFIIKFINLHRDLSSEESVYYLDRYTNLIYHDLKEVSKNILLNPNYNKEDLKNVFDEVSKIDDLLKYDPRVELLRKCDIVESLSSDELLKLFNSDRSELSNKVYLIDLMCKNPEIEKNEKFHEEVNQIILNVRKQKEISKPRTIYQDSSDEERNENIRRSIRNKIAFSLEKDFSKIFEMKKNLDNINSFERLWSIDNIIGLYELKKQKLNFNQIDLLIKLNVILDSLSSSKLNNYFENLELMKYRTFEEILSIASKILPYKFFDNSLDAEQLLIHQSILSNRNANQAMYFVDEIDEYVKEKHSYMGLKALYDIAANVSIDFEVQKRQFNYVKSLENDFDKECATKIFSEAGYIGSTFLECIRYIDEIVKCDIPSKKSSLTDAFKFIVENDKLTSDEKRVLVKLIRDAETKKEAKSISDIVKYSKHLPLSDICSLISLDEQSNISSIMEAQRDLKFMNKIKRANSREEMIEVFELVPETKVNGYFHF